MKRSKIKITALALALGAVSITGCKKFLDINDNPNAPSDADVTLLLPSAQAASGFVLGNQFQIYGSIWGQYWTQSPGASQYRSIDQYSINASSFDRPWRALYTNALQDLQAVIRKSEGAPQYKQYAAIAYIMKGYTFQMLTDAFGDIPVKEANNTDITNPHYDAQEIVYDSIFTFINKGLSLIDVNTEATPHEDDIIFGGHMDQWQRFANTLKLRAFIRLSNVAGTAMADSVAKLQTAALLQQDAKITYSTTGGNQNPLFSEILALGRTVNLAASATAVNAMNANNDPRVKVFYTVDTTNGANTVSGIAQGNYNNVPQGTRFSAPTIVVGADPKNDQSALAPVKLISAAESYFLQSEAVARGWLTGDAKTLYQQGITASFTSYTIDPGTYITTQVAAFPAAPADQIKAIITQKYFAMCGNQGFEAWSEWRRTGFPDFFTPSKVSSLGGTTMPARLLYPNTEVTQNANFPGLVPVATKVWWAKP